MADIKIGINLEFVRSADKNFRAGIEEAARIGYEYVEPCVSTGYDLLAIAGYYHMLSMSDEAGQDQKVLAVPVDKTSGGLYSQVQSTADLPELMLRQISHFFEHYKDLEKGKWVKVEGWQDLKAAEAEILAGLERAKTKG